MLTKSSLFPKRYAMPTVECPKCTASLQAPSKYKGRKVKCKKCGKSFVLRFDGISKPAAADASTVFDFDLAGPPSKKRVERQPKRRSEKSGQRLSLEAEPWRAAIYQRVTDERFNGNFAAFARIALDTMAEQLGYPVRPSAKANSAD
jgi:transcription elongation factor Elf1